MSELFAPTLKESPQEAEVVSHSYMIRAGMIRQLSSGIYTFLPLGMRVIEKISNIVREEMNLAGGQEILMPAMHPGELWKETGRWDIYGPELIRFKDRRERDFCLGPTHEEIITDLARREIKSYRQLPLMLFQIQTKFRDEIRPRFGIMRSREFIMKDLYSFDRDEAGMEKSYQKMYQAYCKVFDRCGLEYLAVPADSGVIGGKISHEFIIVAPTGEERILICPECKTAFPEGREECEHCKTPLEETRGIEVGHIFQLGVKYSEPMRAYFVDQDGSEKPLVMGCYGIGIGRTMAAAIEANHDQQGIRWPWSIAPFEIEIIPINSKEEKIRATSKEIYSQLKDEGYELIIDDRDVRAGFKFSEADLIGVPVQIIVGEKLLKRNSLEVKIRTNGERIEVEKTSIGSALEKIKNNLVRT